MFNLYSRRKKDKMGDPEVFIYDSFPTTFRNQFWAIVKDVFKNVQQIRFNIGDPAQHLCEIFAREKGMKCIPGDIYVRENSIEALEIYCDTCNDEDFLDLMDFIFGFFIANEEVHKLFFIGNQEENFFYEAIEELNWRLKQNSLGYEFVNGEIIPKTNTVTHQQIVKPALKLLSDEEFRGAEEEYLLAFENFRKGENKNAILNATKAFESVMKTICSGLSYNYNKDSDTASKLINILKGNGFFPQYLENHMKGICTTLETGAPTLRNKTSGHGQGVYVQDLSDEYVEYALNLVATNIVFLHRLYKEKKTGHET